MNIGIAGKDTDKKEKDGNTEALYGIGHVMASGGEKSDGIRSIYPMDKVIEGIDKMKNMQPPFNNTITIKLKPPHIGILELKVKMDRDKNISAVISSQDKNAVKIITAHLEGLKTYLSSQGIRVAHIDVHNGFHEQSGFGNAQNQNSYSGGAQQQAGSNSFGEFREFKGNAHAFDSKNSTVLDKKVLNGLDIIV